MAVTTKTRTTKYPSGKPPKSTTRTVYVSPNGSKRIEDSDGSVTVTAPTKVGYFRQDGTKGTYDTEKRIYHQEDSKNRLKKAFQNRNKQTR